MPDHTSLPDVREGVDIAWVPEYEGLYAATTDGRVWSSRSDMFLTNVTDSHGYERVVFKVDGSCDQRHVHRVVKLTFDPPIPDGKFVCHVNGDPTDNRLENLYYGTPKQNAEDRKEHGTEMQGEKHYNSRLCKKGVLEMRKLAEGGMTYTEIAEHFDCAPPTVQAICVGNSWSHVGGPRQEAGRAKGELSGHAKVTKQDVVAIRQLYDSGQANMIELADRYGLSDSTIHSIVHGDTWTHVGGPTQSGDCRTN